MLGRIVLRGRLHDRRQAGGLAQGQSRGGLVVVPAGRRLEPIGPRTEIDPAEVEPQDVLLRIGLLKFDGVDQFGGLALHRAVSVQEQVAGQLLGQGRCPLRGLAFAQVADNGPGHAHGVEAVVRIEPAILDRDEGGGHIGRQAGDIHRRTEPPASHPQHLSLPVHIGNLRITLDRRQRRELGPLGKQGSDSEQGDQGHVSGAAAHPPRNASQPSVSAAYPGSGKHNSR